MPRVDRAPQPPSPLARPTAQRRRPGPRGALAPPRTRDRFAPAPSGRLRHAQADPAPRGRRPRDRGLLELRALRFVSGLRRGDVRRRTTTWRRSRRTTRTSRSSRPATPYDGVTYQDPGVNPYVPAERDRESTFAPRRRHRVATRSPSATSATATSPTRRPSASRSSSTPSTRTTPRPTDGTFAISSDGGPSPFLDEDEVLLRVGVQAKRGHPPRATRTPRSRSSSTPRARWPARTGSGSSSRR